MGNCLPSRDVSEGEVCSEEKAMIKPGKVSSPQETDSQSTTTDCKRHMGPPITSAYPQDATNGGSKKIRLLVTKQELRELLSKRMSVEELLAGVHREGRYKVDFCTRWQPLLETIPEEVSNTFCSLHCRPAKLLSIHV